jgi:hypothetical protein
VVSLVVLLKTCTGTGSAPIFGCIFLIVEPDCGVAPTEAIDVVDAPAPTFEVEHPFRGACTGVGKLCVDCWWRTVDTEEECLYKTC